jgi:hypothetical protein
MDYYDFVIARAKEISERQRQEEVEDNDIQSNSNMEGIETSGVELSDTEIGSIAGSSSLADQDSQDGQDGQEDVGSRVGSRVGREITIQGAGTSPRHTRSGKIVKYKDE